MPNPLETPLNGGSDIIKQFQLSSDTKWKSDIKVGHRLARDIQATLGGNTSYYFIRNSRFAKNRSMVAGRYDMSRFMDRLQMNAKFNYVNISWLPFHIVSTIVARKVGAWMTRNEKISVSAVDAESEKVKKEQYEEAEFYLDNKEQIQKLERESGVQIMPKGAMPQDKDELDIWAVENNRLPEEIKYETGTNSLLGQEGLFDVLKERELRDSAITGLVGLYTWMDEKGVIHNEYVKPEDAIYSYSEFPDFRDTTWRARIISRKISWIRRKYSVEFGGKMTEQEIFELAQTSKEYQVPDKIRWVSEWSYSTLRPYDEWNIDCIEIAFKSLDADGFKMKVTKSGSLIMDKSGKPFEPSENKEYIPDDGWNMYWGVYARIADKMLEWGLMKNQIKAQDVKEIGNVEFPFSFYMYQNEDMRNLAIPEKVEKPFEQMCLILLQMEKLITRYKPPGARVNVSAIRELDLGLADLQKPLDLEKHWEQTGIYYMTDTDAEGNKISDPITEMANAGFRENALGLREMYMFWYQTLKDELGEDPNLVQQAVQPRVTEGNVQTSQQLADNSTDYMFDAYKYIVTEAARKTACLMHDSVSFGANVYRHIIGEDEVRGRVFATKVKMLPTDREIAVLEAQINQAIASNQDLVMYLNTFKILRIAKEDIKLAEEYFRLGMKRMLQSKIEQNRENQAMTFEGQAASAERAEAAKQETERIKIDGDIKKSEVSGKSANISAVINMVAAWVKPNADGTPGQVPPEYQPFVKTVFESVMIGAIASTEEEKAKLIEQMEAAKQQMQPPIQGQPNQIQQPPQEEIAA